MNDADAPKVKQAWTSTSIVTGVPEVGVAGMVRISGGNGGNCADALPHIRRADRRQIATKTLLTAGALGVMFAAG